MLVIGTHKLRTLIYLFFVEKLNAGSSRNVLSAKDNEINKGAGDGVILPAPQDKKNKEILVARCCIHYILIFFLLLFSFLFEIDTHYRVNSSLITCYTPLFAVPSINLK